MKDLKSFSIAFKGLKQGKHVFKFYIDKKLFDAYGFDEFKDCEVTAIVILLKSSTFFELAFKLKGSVCIPCDLSNELFNQQISGNLNLTVKFGKEYQEQGEIIVLPYDTHQINISQYLYESIILSVPKKRVHPKVLNGTMKSKVLAKLNELKVEQINSNQERNSTDPRWDKLKELLTDK
ncbi:MAG: YceD family protein [Tenacibaculum sp.]